MTAFADLESALDAGILSAFSNASATAGAATFNVIFDAEYSDALGLGNTSPSCLADDDDVSAVAVDSSISIGGTSYTVREKHSDGTGNTRLILEAA